MRYLTTKSRTRIRRAIDLLSLNRRPITLRIQGDETFTSRVLKVDHGDPPAKNGTSRRLIIDWLFPAKGNGLIQSPTPFLVRFSIGKTACEFTSKYLSKSVESPHFGHTINYPDLLAVADRREQDRHALGGASKPIFRSARLRAQTSRNPGQSMDLSVLDVCEKGIGILIGKEFYDFLEKIRIGDRFTEVELCAPWTIVRVDGTVRHKSQIREGKYRGYHVVGIELDEKLERFI